MVNVLVRVFISIAEKDLDTPYIFRTRPELRKVNWDSVQMAREKRAEPDMSCHLPRRYARVCK